MFVRAHRYLVIGLVISIYLDIGTFHMYGMVNDLAYLNRLLTYLDMESLIHPLWTTECSRSSLRKSTEICCNFRVNNDQTSHHFPTLMLDRRTDCWATFTHPLAISFFCNKLLNPNFLVLILEWFNFLHFTWRRDREHRAMTWHSAKIICFMVNNDDWTFPQIGT